MTKSDLIEEMARRSPAMSLSDVEIAVNEILDSITRALKLGDRVEIRGFGTFTVRQRQARAGRNPKSGSVISVPERRVPFFTVGQALRQRVDSPG
jgi:integration host factor subunit beta